MNIAPRKKYRVWSTIEDSLAHHRMLTDHEAESFKRSLNWNCTRVYDGPVISKDDIIDVQLELNRGA